jgi:mycothiol synthase
VGRFPPEPAARLSPGEAAEVRALAAAAAEVDGVFPLSEAGLLRLRDGGAADAVHLTTRLPDGDLAGYAQRAAGEAELVVAPAARRRGIGRALLDAVTADDPGVRVWAHGDLPAAAALAASAGFARARVLWQLRRPLGDAPLPEVELPPGVHLRAFRPGEDEAAWLGVNARAFAGHPEQGRWTVDDLRARMAEPWFDPAGFLLAVGDTHGRLLGFHWTKVHPGRLGEVYVLGVDPGADRRGLGRALTAAGLHHLAGLGLADVMLYVDESNSAAMRLYRRLGFDGYAADVMYQRGLPN